MSPLKKSLQKEIGRYRLYLLDLDGTTYIENDLIPGALDFIRSLRKKKLDYVFLTNNSSKSALEYVASIRRLNIPVSLNNVFTSGQATGLYLTKNKGRSRPRKRIFLVGTKSLKKELCSYGIVVETENIKNIDYVVIGFDRELDYKKLEKACELIDRGVSYIATNPDLVCPIRENRFIPDCGSICQMIFNATGKKPRYIGKPEPTMVDILAKVHKVKKSQIVMIGDRLYTDMALGKSAGIATICVLSGESSLADIKKSRYKPDFIIGSINEMNDYLQ